jgi:large subunit ribosomal protein L4e
MKVAIKDTNNKELGSTQLPEQFSEEYRPDLIVRSVLSLQANARTPYGAKATAGKRASAELSRRRRKYRGSYGFGISRVPRKILSRNGTRFNWVGAFAPGTVGGRRAHPPKPTKDWSQKINKTENRKAIRSALAATLNKELVAARGHKVPKDYPFLIGDDFEAIAKTKDAVAALEKLDLGLELERSAQKKIRAGKGTMRNRKYKKKTGPLLVVSKKDTALAKGARNVPGIDVVVVDELNTQILAPGTHAGRITLFTQSAIARLAEEKLFTQHYKGVSAEKPTPAKPAKKATKKVAKKAVKKASKKATKKAPAKKVAQKVAQ